MFSRIPLHVSNIILRCSHVRWHTNIYLYVHGLHVCVSVAHPCQKCKFFCCYFVFFYCFFFVITLILIPQGRKLYKKLSTCHFYIRHFTTFFVLKQHYKIYIWKFMEMILIYKLTKKLLQNGYFPFRSSHHLLILHILYYKFYAPKISFARTMAEAITLSMS